MGCVAAFSILVMYQSSSQHITCLLDASNQLGMLLLCKLDQSSALVNRLMQNTLGAR